MRGARGLGGLVALELGVRVAAQGMPRARGQWTEAGGAVGAGTSWAPLRAGKQGVVRAPRASFQISVGQSLVSIPSEPLLTCQHRIESFPLFFLVQPSGNCLHKSHFPASSWWK